MLAVFEKSIARQPEEFDIFPGIEVPETRAAMAQLFDTEYPNSIFYHFANGNFMALSHQDEDPGLPRSIMVLDDIFCIFIGSLENICDLRRHYGLPRHTTEAMLVIEVYKVLRDRAPCPPDQVIKDLSGKFAFVLFDTRTSRLFIARDRDGGVGFFWGQAHDGSLAFSDNSEAVLDLCGMATAHFPEGCIYSNNHGLVSFMHPMHKMRAIVSKGDRGIMYSIYFQVDLYSRLPSIRGVMPTGKMSLLPMESSEKTKSLERIIKLVKRGSGKTKKRKSCHFLQ